MNNTISDLIIFGTARQCHRAAATDSDTTQNGSERSRRCTQWFGVVQVAVSASRASDRCDSRFTVKMPNRPKSWIDRGHVFLVRSSTIAR